MDEQYIRECIRLAEKARVMGEEPFGSVVVCKKKIVGKASNYAKHMNNPTCHAEILALRRAQKELKEEYLNGCILYSNCEPCPMCSFMIREVRIKRVVFALPSPHMGGHTKWRILSDKKLALFKPFSHPPSITSGILKDEAKEIFKKAGYKKMFNRGI